MYRVYIQDILLPIAPEEIKITSANQNSTVALVDESQFSVIKLQGLSEYEFSFILPKYNYHFAIYENSTFVDADNFIDEFTNMKTQKKILDFTIVTEDGENIFINKQVTLEDFVQIYNANAAGDYEVYITLKDYVHHETKLVTLTELSTDTGVTRIPAQTSEYETYTIQSGDTLSAIAMRFYGSASYYMEIYELNKTLLDEVAVSRGMPSESGHWWIFPGTVIDLP